MGERDNMRQSDKVTYTEAERIQTERMEKRENKNNRTGANGDVTCRVKLIGGK